MSEHFCEQHRGGEGGDMFNENYVARGRVAHFQPPLIHGRIVDSR